VNVRACMVLVAIHPNLEHPSLKGLRPAIAHMTSHVQLL
jgi:hypothetical protein